MKVCEGRNGITVDPRTSNRFRKADMTSQACSHKRSDNVAVMATKDTEASMVSLMIVSVHMIRVLHLRAIILSLTYTVIKTGLVRDSRTWTGNPRYN